LITDNGYTDVLSAQVEVKEDVSQEKEEEEKEEEKETFDEDNVEDEDQEETQQENEDGNDQNEGNDSASNTVEKKDEPVPGEGSHENDRPANDIKKAISDNCTGLICSGGLIVTLLLSFLFCFCCYRCYCAPMKKTSVPRTYTEVELSVGSSYKDDFVDEDDAEYGEPTSTFKDI
jgi:hypothetical protein